MPDNKQKTKVFTDKKLFDKANQAYNDSLNLFNYTKDDIKKLKKLERESPTLQDAWLKWYNLNNDDNKLESFEKSRINLKNINNKWPEPINFYHTIGGGGAEEYKKPTTKPVYQPEVTNSVSPIAKPKPNLGKAKPRPKIEPIKPLGIKPMNTSVEPKLADKKQEIIQEPMNKKQTYTASPNLKKMGKSTGREYVDGQWIETKSKGGTVKKYAVGGGFDLLGSVDPSIMKNLTTAPKTFTPSTTAPAVPASTGSNFQMPSLGGGGSSAPQQTSQDPNAPKKKNIGKIVGSVVGGVAGSLIAPGVGTMIGSTIGGGIGGAIDNKTYQNKVEDYTATAIANKSSQQNAMISNIPGNFNPNAQTKQFKKGGELIKRADGSYSKRGLWDNIRANKGSGKAPTKEMLEQEKKIKANMAHGGIDTSNSMSGPKYLDGGMLKPMGNDMYEVKSYKKGTDKVEYRPNVFIDNKEIIRKNSDGSTQILSDDLGYAKVAKNIAKAKGGNITDEQFDQLYMNQEMSKASKGKGNKYVEGGTDKKLKLRNPMSDDRATSVLGNFDSFGAGKPVSGSIDAGYSPDKFNIDPKKGLTVKPFTYKTPGSLGYDTPKKQPGAFDVKTPEVDLKASKFIGETKGKYEYNPQVPKDKKSLDTKVNPLGYLSSLAGPAYNIAQGLKGGDPVDFERMNTKYQFADPRGAMAAASRGVTSAYNAAKNAAKTTTTSAGEYLANMGNLASKEGIDRAAALTNIKAQYDMANTQGLNQTNLAKDQFNAQTQMQESIARQQEKDAARSSISKGLAGLSQNTMGYMSDVNANKTQRRFVDLINSGKYEYVEEIDADGKPRIKLVPKKGAKSNSVQVTPSPTKQTEPATE